MAFDSSLQVLSSPSRPRLSPFDPPACGRAAAGFSPATARVLVVVPALDEEATITPLLQRLLAEPAGVRMDVAVVDGGSGDRTVARVRALQPDHPNLHLLHNPARIQSAAVNLAARVLGREADVLVRCDAHAEYPPQFCARLLEALARTGADAVVVPLDSVGRTCLQRAVAWVSDTPVGSGGSAHRAGRRSGFVDHGHHAAFRVDMFRRVGGYDESYTHNEDAEFDCRQRALGARIYLDAEIRVTYHPRARLGALARQYGRYGSGRSRTVRRHPGSMRARQWLVPLHVLACAVAVAAAPWWAWALWWPVAYLCALGGTSLALAWRHRSACGLLAGPAAGVMHTAWALGFLRGLVASREPAWHPGLATPLWPARA